MADITNYIRKEGLPGDLLGNLEMVTLNAGASFLRGEAANSFARVDNIIDDALLTFNTVTDPNLIKKITVDLGEHCLTVATNAITTYMTDRLSDLTDIAKISDRLLQSIGYWTTQKTLKPDQLLSYIVTQNIQDKNKKAQDDEQKQKLNDIKERISYGIGVCKEYKEKILGSLEGGISTITAYVTAGPDWVVSQANSYTALVVEKATTFIGSQAQFLENTRDAAIESLGCTIGTAAAGTINELAKLAAKKAKSQLEELIASAQIKLVNAIIKITMVLRQLTGLAFPINVTLPNITNLL